MEREELRNLPPDYAWTREALTDTFAVIMGGVAFPGRRPGFAVVAGLCHPNAKSDCEIHVLGEVESPDLGELLRACRGLGAKYRRAGMLRNEPFRWFGNGKHVGAQDIIWRLNRESGNQFDRLDIESTVLLDDPTPYLTMFSLLSGFTRPEQKRLYLHGCTAAHAMNELPPDELAETKLGEYPSVEALAFVVGGLREWLDYRPTGPVDRNASPYGNWARFNRGKNSGASAAAADAYEAEWENHRR